MSHHEEEKNFDYVYYLVALLSGAFVGAIVDRGFIWIPVGAILGLLSAGLFIKVLVSGREEV
ncbi:hypothetical protein [Mucilaginibacter gilvus]|uniref:Uncharacterized protein n=1 Tax=Mucilaginibacter gilvus TaxID=2305909 RepID=A0A3S3UR76_9SPHI|nr:hypothetical protein [Mucilaginibacter gilvus]RWY52419.1 hypothetical protein EPL05_10960 [Mucilaginibacter gilvus]